jgi:hypothetical protein
MHIEQLREMVPPPSQNTVAVCNQFTLLILYYISSKLVILLKVSDAPIQVSDIFYLTVSFNCINFSLQTFFLLFLKCLLASRLTFFRLSTLLWFGCRNHCIWAASFDLNNTNILHQTIAGFTVGRQKYSKRHKGLL